MARTVTLNGSNYSVPETSDTGYDAALTSYFVALATAFPQLNGTNGTLTAELDFGAAFGLKSLYYKSRTANAAAAGQVRLASADVINFRNNANGADVSLAKDTADNLTFGGAYVTGNPMLVATSSAGQTIGSGATTIVVFGTVETDSDSAYNSGTGRYTVPAGKGGDYTITANTQMNSTQAGVADLQVFKNAAQAKFLGPGVNTQTAGLSIGGTITLRLLAGDVIDIRLQNAGAGGQTLSAVAAINYFTLKRIPT